MIPRAKWGAAPPKRPLTPQANYAGLVLHWNATFPRGYRERDDESHAQWLRNIQAWALNHPTIPFVDFPYNVARDIFGNEYEGRGIGKRSGGEGPLKLKYRGKQYLSYFVMTGYEVVDDEKIEVVPFDLDALVTDVNAVREQAGILDKPVHGHGRVRRPFLSGADKDCPGPTLLALVESGGFDVAPVVPVAIPAQHGQVPIPTTALPNDLSTDLMRVSTALTTAVASLNQTIRNLEE